MICTVDNMPDGFWKKVNNYVKIDQDAIQDVFKMISPYKMRKALTMVVSTKVNFWQTNYHTGLGNNVICNKNLLYFYPYNAEERVLMHVAHYLGHFASTLKVLQIAGFHNLRQAVPFVYNVGASLTLSADMKLGFQSMPAGTEKLAVAFEAAKKLVMSLYAEYCPRLQDFQAIPIIRNQIIADPVRYHISATYLTGQPRAEYTDSDMDLYLGRLGTYVRTVCKTSTLLDSQYMKQYKIYEYEDYDQNFKNVLMRVQEAVDHGRVIRSLLWSPQR